MKIGDIVRIINFKDSNKFVTPEMYKFRNKTATIKDIYIDNKGFVFYYLDVDSGTYGWVEELLELYSLEIPEGYVVDQIVNNKILLKKKELPKTWEECLRTMDICEYISNYSEICVINPDQSGNEKDHNMLPSGLGVSMLAFMQLLVCRDVYRNGWKPNWDDDSKYKYSIDFRGKKTIACFTTRIFSFQSKEVRDEFEKNFGKLIRKLEKLL